MKIWARNEVSLWASLQFSGLMSQDPKEGSDSWVVCSAEVFDSP